MRFKSLGILFLLSFGVLTVDAQIGLIPLYTNPQIKKYLHERPNYTWNNNRLNKWGKPDTLKLPFFEDFSQNSVYPDSSKWLDNTVFINSDLPVRPPSIGVATFDYLDAEGNPYGPLEKDKISGADTLTSQYIDLSGLGLSDSVILSFFYQRIGLGDYLTDKDSLKLQFRISDSAWTQVWSAAGGAFSEFEQVVIRIEDPKFLTEAFQFRFANKTYQWGNNNHWHVDYILLNKNRTVTKLDYTDCAIQTKPTSLLSNYYSMPYAHYLADVAGETADSIFFYASNMNNGPILAEARHVEKWEGNTLVSTNYSDNTANISGNGQALRRLKNFDFSSLTGDTVVIERTYYVKESGITDPFMFQVNDNFTVEQKFENYFAMDDGTAESSFGFNDLKHANGIMAIKFNLNMPDTLRAISYFFTPNVEDASHQKITLKIWSSIGYNGGTTNLLWDSVIVLPNLYEAGYGPMVIFPGDIPLPAGEFYIGWEQDANFNLSIGFDRNDGYRAKRTGPNEDIYFNVGTGWLQNSNPLLAGAPMIRVYVGNKFQFASVPDVSTEDQLKIYPSPASDQIRIEGIYPDNWSVFNISGQNMSVVTEKEPGVFDVSGLTNGIYFIRIESNGRVVNKKFVVQH